MSEIVSLLTVVGYSLIKSQNGVFPLSLLIGLSISIFLLSLVRRMTTKAERAIILAAAIITTTFAAVGFYLQYGEQLQLDDQTARLLIFLAGSVSFGLLLHYLYSAAFNALARALTLTTFDPVLRETRIKRGNSILIEIRAVTRQAPIGRRFRLFNGYVEIMIRNPHGEVQTILRYARRTDPIEGHLQSGLTGNSPLQAGWEISKDAILGEYVVRIFLKDKRPYDWMYFQNHTYTMAERVIKYTVTE